MATHFSHHKNLLMANFSITEILSSNSFSVIINTVFTKITKKIWKTKLYSGLG
nr:MAG TPA: hypothetical protein [Caudoviricetes sp.]